jgi:glutathione S-transferase
MTEIILHHYDRSPFAEKVRLVFGLKNVSWRAVDIPVFMPKPDLIPLTGGYRRTPVMQIGADVFCDTRLILREIDRRFPTPPLYRPGGGGLIAAWADSTLFVNAVGVVFGTFADQMPKEFKEDRVKTSNGLFDADRLKAEQPAQRAQYRAYMRAIESELSDGHTYLQGNAPGIADFAVYHCVWFVSARVKEMDFLAGCPMLRAWRDRMAGFGQGMRTPLSPADALAIARESTPMPVAPSLYDDLGGCALGQEIAVAANDYGRDPVRGVLLSIDDNEIIIARRDPALGEVNVHFPRIGFDVMPAS